MTSRKFRQNSTFPNKYLFSRFTNPKSLAVHEMEHEGISDEEPVLISSKPVSSGSKPVSSGSKTVSAGSKTAKTKEPGSSDPKPTCPICFQTFQRLFNMRTHINRVSAGHRKLIEVDCSFGVRWKRLKISFPFLVPKNVDLLTYSRGEFCMDFLFLFMG